MAGINENLDIHHARIEAQFARVLSAARAGHWAEFRTRFPLLRLAVLDHIACEEQAPFPALAGKPGGEAAARSLQAEHGRLRRHFDTLSAAAPEHDPAGFMGELEELGALLQKRHEGELQLAESVVGAPSARQALDLRGLQPPEPIVRILAALDRAPDEPLRAILPHEPVPLYTLLRERGFRYSGETRPDGGYELMVEKA